MMLRVPNSGVKEVVFEEIILPTKFQGRGLSAQLIKPYYEQYRKAGVDCIRLVASDIRGGYAWAKYGFRATHVSDLYNILDRLETTTITREIIAELRKTLINFYLTNSDAVPFPIRIWTPFPFSKELLMNKTWRGVLDLNDEEHRKFFEDYLYAHP